MKQGQDCRSEGLSHERRAHCCGHPHLELPGAGDGAWAKIRWGWRWFWHLMLQNRVAIAVASLIWLLYRSGTQPRRLSYPCQQVAAVNVGAVVAGLIPAALLSRRHKGGKALPKAVIVKRQLAVAAILVVVGIVGIESYQFADSLIQPAATLPNIPSPPTEPGEAIVGMVHQARAGTQYTEAEIDSMVELAVQRAGGLDQIMVNKKPPNNEILVVLKPNLVNDISVASYPENGVVTDHRVMKSVVRLVKEAGLRTGISTRVVIAEGTAGPADWNNGYMGRDITRYAFITTGYTTDPVPVLETDKQRFIHDSSVELVDLNDTGGLDEHDMDKVIPVVLDYGVIRSVYWVPLILWQCDVLISVPTLKNHGNADTTIALKNRIGCAPSDIYHARSQYGAGHTEQMKYALHFMDIPSLNQWDPGSGGGFYYPPQPTTDAENLCVNYSVVDMNMVRPQDFAVVDGLVGITNGPTGTNKMSPNQQMIMAGKDSVAVDTVGTLLMGYDPRYIRYLRLAYNRQLGTMNRGKIAVIGDRTALWRQYFTNYGPNNSPCETIPPTLGGISIPEGSPVTSGDTITASDFVDSPTPPVGETGIARVEAAATILGSNLVANGDFEQGDNGAWQAWQSSWGSDMVRDFNNTNVSPEGGTKCLRLGNSATTGSYGVYQEVAVTPGKTYRLDCQWKGVRKEAYPALSWWEVILIDGPFSMPEADQDPGVRLNYMFAYDNNTYGLQGPAGTTFGWIWTHEQYAPPKNQVDWNNRLGRRKATGSTMTVVLKAGTIATGGIETYFDNVTLREVQSEDYIIASAGMATATENPNVASPCSLIADLSALPTGQFPGELRVTVYDAALNEASEYRNVALQPCAPEAWVCVTPDTIVRNKFVSDPMPSGDTLEVWNCGCAGDSLTYDITTNVPWLHVLPADGSSPLNPPTTNVHTISYDPLPPGQHVGIITITGAHNAKTVVVTMNVSTVDADLDQDGDVDVVDFGKLQVCYGGTALVIPPDPCAVADLNHDQYVNNFDYAVLSECLKGADEYPEADCGQ